MKLRTVFFLVLLSHLLPMTAQDRQTILSTGLTLVEITTVDGEQPSCDYVRHPSGCYGKSISNMTKVPGRLTITKGETMVYDSGDYQEDVSGMTVRIRGNASAWDFYPPPYKIKLQKKADLLCRNNDDVYKDKNWLLLRDVELRTMIGFKAGELAGVQWTPGYEYVNVIFNDDYQGVYILMESVRRNPDCRLNVSKTGFVFEYDQYWWNTELYVESTIEETPMNYTFKYPEEEDMTEAQLSYFTDLMSRVEQSVVDGTYPDYIDVESFARWMLVRDIIGCRDGTGANYYLTKYDNTSSSKIMMGNLWDLDGCLINYGEWDGAHNHFFFKVLFEPDCANKAFVETYIRLWEELSPTLFDDMERWLDHLNNSSEGEALTKSLELALHQYDKKAKSVNYCVVVSQKWFRIRKEWMTEAVAELKAIVSGISPVTKTDPSLQEQIYRIDGRRIQHEMPGLNIIRNHDGTIQKVLKK